MKKLFYLAIILLAGWNLNAQATLEAELSPGSADRDPIGSIVYNGKLYFWADDGAGLGHGWELWSWDGTTATMVANIYPGGMGNSASDFAIYNGKLYFRADDGVNSEELWSWDGTSAVMEADIVPGSQGSSPIDFEVYNGKLYFRAYTASTEYELWSWDGTSAVMEADIYPGIQNSNPTGFTEFSGKLYFAAIDATTSAYELWSWDGTTVTKETNFQSGPAHLTVFGSKLYFSGSGNGNGRELWSWDGTTATAEADIYPGSWNSNPRWLTVFGSKLYFQADGGYPIGEELWSWDGTTATLEADIYPGYVSSSPDNLHVFNSRLYFGARDAVHGKELYAWDGTTAALAADIAPSIGSSPEYLTEFNSKLYFSAYTQSSGRELWSFVEPVPTITNFSPASGPVGTEVTIEGDNLDEVTDVQFNGVSTSDFSFSNIGGSTVILAIVPAGASPGTISVENYFGNATSSTDFTVDAGLVVTSSQNVPGTSYANVAVANGGVATFDNNITVSGDIIILNGGKAYFKDINLTGGGQVIVREGGFASLKQSCHVITGSGSFELKDGATLEICSAQGITTSGATGNIQVSGTRTFSQGANYVYVGDADEGAQVTGNGLPSTVKSLTINNSFGVTLSQATSVTDSVLLKAGQFNTQGNLTLESGAVLMHGAGTPGGNNGTISSDDIVMKRTGHSVSNQWNFWGSPVTGEQAGVLGGRLHKYNVLNATDMTTAGLQAGWETVSGSDVMEPGIGYISTGGGTVSFEGTVDYWNSGPTLQVTIDKTNANGGVPYNTLGNPFPSAIDAEAFLLANSTIIDGVINLWDDDGTGGSGYSQADFAQWDMSGMVNGPNTGIPFDGYIQPGQGFSVEKLNTGQDDVVFTNAMRGSEKGVFFKRAPIDRLWISVENSQSLYNETLIAFVDNATDGRDWGYDASKMRGNSNIALYTKMGTEDLAIQTFGELTTDRVVELGLDAGLTGDHILKLKQIENIDETVEVVLEDRQAGTFQNLRVDPEYTFTVTNAGTITGRFYLHFNAPLQVEATAESCMGADGQITLNQSGSQHWNYIIADRQGNLIGTQQAFNGTQAITGLEGGEYTLVLTDQYGYQITKMITVEAVQQVTSSFEADKETVQVNEPVTFINLSTGASGYTWDFGDGTSMSSFSDPVHYYSEAGSYMVKLRAYNDDCQNNFYQNIEVLKTTGIADAPQNQLMMYSNQKTIYLRFDYQKEEKAQVEVYDVLGKKVYERNLSTTGNYQLDMNNLATNYYLVRVKTASSAVTRKMILLQ